MKKRKSPTYKHPMHYIRAAARKAKPPAASEPPKPLDIPSMLTPTPATHEVRVLCEAARYVSSALVKLASLV